MAEHPLARASSTDRQLQLEAEQTRLLYAQAPTSLIVTTVNAVVLVAVLRSVVAPSALLGWLALMVTVSLARGLLMWRFRRAAPPAEDHRVWRRRFIIGAFCAGSGWGSAALILCPAGSQAYQTFIAFVLGGMITGGVAVLSWAPGVFIAFVLPTALPLIARFALEGGELFLAMAGLAVVFVVAVVTTSRQLQHSVAESLALRFEKTALIEDLSQSERRTAAANVALRAEIAERTHAEEALRLARVHLEERVEARTSELLSSVTALRQEVAARTEAERALQRERDRLEVTLASIGDAVIATDEAATVTFMNPVAETVTGWRARDAVGHPVRDVLQLCDEQSREPIDSPLERVLRDGVVVGLTNRAIVTSRSGRTIPIADSGSPIRGKDGRVHGAVMVFRDVTERRETELALRKAKDAAEAADQRKNEFLAMLSHELRNPLAPIRTSLDILHRAPPRSDRAERAQAVIERQVAHLTRLVDDLLDITRISRGKILLHRESLDLTGVVRHTADDQRDTYATAGVTLVVRVPEPPVPIYGDRTRLVQVVGNLLQNAAKFTPEGGIVELSVETDAEHRVATIRVRDTGVGIVPEMLPRLFEPFAQADSSLERSGGGLGLGLALVQTVAELHGGTVTAESEGPGRGATFSVRLPLQLAPVEARESRLPASAHGRSRRVLVVEDNTDAGASLRELLELDGHVVELASNGAEGVAKARTFQPDVVLCDLGLPGMDGFAVARAFRADVSLQHVRLVAVSGYARPEDVARSREAGFDAHLAKPVPIDRLAAELSTTTLVRC